MTTDLQAARPRVVVEQQPDGTFVVESYINGARHREPCDAGHDLLYVLRTEIDRQTRLIADKAEAAQLRKERAEDALHRKVWRIAAATPGQGKQFANRTIGPLNTSPVGDNPILANYKHVGPDGAGKVLKDPIAPRKQKTPALPVATADMLFE